MRQYIISKFMYYHLNTKMAQSRGFEPPKVLPLLVFETSAFNHSAKTAFLLNEFYIFFSYFSRNFRDGAQIFLLRPQNFYNSSFLSSSPLFFDKYAGGISKTVLAPYFPSSFNLYVALAKAINTEAVNSGFESNFKEYSIICLFPSPVSPLRITKPPCAIFE